MEMYDNFVVFTNVFIPEYLRAWKKYDIVHLLWV